MGINGTSALLSRSSDHSAFRPVTRALGFKDHLVFLLEVISMTTQDAHDREGPLAMMMKRLIIGGFIAAAAISFSSGTTAGQAGAAKPQTPHTQSQSRERFDSLVRADFFSGYAGDQAALDRGMKVCEDTLAKNPNHAEALVWHGGGLVFIAGQAFQRADFRKGADLWDRGLQEMDRAIELEPGNVGVLIPRGATLLEVSRFVPDKAAQRGLLEKGIGDYERVLELQKTYFGKLSGHARGELLYGLAEGCLRLGNTEKARAYFQRIVSECKDSGRQSQAATWLEKGTLTGADAMSCTGCHKR
jgi:tetratricopeptide (TPR) repeat protein